MPEGEHQFVNVTLAGARSPRAASKQGETSEPWADEVSHIRGPSCAAWATNFSLGEILYRIASASAPRESATSLVAHCDCHPVSNQQQHCTGTRERIYWHRLVAHSGCPISFGLT
jgi:staphylococcal nuclease domain-containing protein 1